MKPTIGRVVLYKLRDMDATLINERRHAWRNHESSLISSQHGLQQHEGNPVHAYDVCPATVVRVWPSDGTVNLKVSLDGAARSVGRQHSAVQGRWRRSVEDDGTGHVDLATPTGGYPIGGSDGQEGQGKEARYEEGR